MAVSGRLAHRSGSFGCDERSGGIRRLAHRCRHRGGRRSWDAVDRRAPVRSWVRSSACSCSQRVRRREPSRRVRRRSPRRRRPNCSTSTTVIHCRSPATPSTGSRSLRSHRGPMPPRRRRSPAGRRSTHRWNNRSSAEGPTRCPSPCRSTVKSCTRPRWASGFPTRSRRSRRPTSSASPASPRRSRRSPRCSWSKKASSGSTTPSARSSPPRSASTSRAPASPASPCASC